MRIQKIDFLTRNFTQTNPKQEKQTTENHSQIREFNPPAYKDFNINFTARLFRTPENFYAQPFNQFGMPVTMKDYLYDDFEDRQKMPPAQMLKIVFGDIKEVKSLEQAKRLYPNEPLFETLTDTPNKKSRTGVIAEIDVMKKDGKSLFKNGQDNLGLYILKKIYTEGKTLKEINSDFEKDISVHYKGLSPIEYTTLDAYGIKFPNRSFWKSFTATREEFPYEYKPRKAIAPRATTVSGTHTPKAPAESKPRVQKGKFDDVKDWEIDKLTDALIKGNGSKSETEKNIKKRNLQNKESTNFVTKYLGEINSIVLEKLHISPDMKDFFENYDGLSTDQRKKFEEYMKNPYINELRSKVMSYVIKYFFNVYGVDGNNEEFQELLDYAHNIKTRRLEEQKLHDEKQLYYDEIFANYIDPTEKQEEVKPETMPVVDIDDDDDEKDTIEHFQKLLDEVKAEFDVSTYTFNTEEGEVAIVGNMKESIGEHLHAKYSTLPTAFVNNYVKFVQNHPLVSDDFVLTTLLEAKNIQLPQDDRLMDSDSAENVRLTLMQEYTDQNPNENRAAQQAITDAFINISPDDITPDLYRLGVFEFAALYRDITSEQKALINQQAKEINKNFIEYKKPISDPDARKVTIAICDLLRKYDENKSIIKKPTPFEGLNDVFKGLSYVVQKKTIQRENLKHDLTEYIKQYGSTAKFLIDKNVPEKLKSAKMEQLLCSYMYDKPGIILTYVALDKDAMDYLKLRNHEIYDHLKSEVLLKAPFFRNDNVD